MHTPKALAFKFKHVQQDNIIILVLQNALIARIVYHTALNVVVLMYVHNVLTLMFFIYWVESYFIKLIFI